MSFFKELGALLLYAALKEELDRQRRHQRRMDFLTGLGRLVWAFSKSTITWIIALVLPFLLGILGSIIGNRLYPTIAPWLDSIGL